MSHASPPQSVMPMVDHLEELRRRLFWSLGAVAAATAAALAVVFAFPVIRLLERPIAAYLPSHKLAFTHPTDPFDIAMHTAIAFGIVAALPIVLHQAWAFVRPAMSKGCFTYIARVVTLVSSLLASTMWPLQILMSFLRLTVTVCPH